MKIIRELITCPFCGNIPNILNGCLRVTIHCSECEFSIIKRIDEKEAARQGLTYTQDEAIACLREKMTESWNTRHTPALIMTETLL